MKDKYIAITLGVIVVIILNILVFFAMKHTNKEDADRYSSYAQESKPKPKPYTPRVIKFINEFKKKCPSWNQNDIIREKTNEVFGAEFALTKMSDKSFLSDIPLKLKGIKEYSSGKYAANLYYESYSYGIIVHFNIIGLISEKYIDTLKQGNKYSVKGKFLKFIRGDASPFANNSSVYTDDVGYSKDVLTDGDSYDLGIILMKITDIKPA